MRQRVSARRYQTEHRSECDFDGPDLRRLSSVPFEDDTLLPDGWRDLFDQHVAASLLPHLKVQRLSQRLEAAARCVHALLSGRLAKRAIAVARDNSKTSRVYLNAWDAVVAAGYADVQVGSEDSGKVTRYYGTAKLLAVPVNGITLVNTTLSKVNDPMEAGSRQDKRLTVFKSGRRAEGNRKQENRLINIVEYVHSNMEDTAAAQHIRRIRAMEGRLNNINRINLQHAWMASTWDDDLQCEVVYQPNVVLRQFFTGELYRAGRLYSWGLNGQLIPSADRKRILIDNEPVVELDYSAMAVRMLYNQRGIDPPKQHDLYKPDLVFEEHWPTANDAFAGRMREAVKRATTIMWNTASRAEAYGAVRGSFHQEHPALGRTLAAADLSVDNLLDRIEAAHPQLADDFYSLAALDIQTLDGQIMLDVLDECTSHGIPVLGVHDSCVCKAIQSTEVERFMVEMYREVMGYEPVVRREH